MAEELQVCGRPAQMVPPQPSGSRTKQGKYKPNKLNPFQRKPYAKVVVEGINHRNGEPIRFRSIKRAENHITNMYGA